MRFQNRARLRTRCLKLHEKNRLNSFSRFFSPARAVWLRGLQINGTECYRAQNTGRKAPTHKYGNMGR